MSGTPATLLVAATCLLGIALFALNHRRDAMGAVLAVVLGFDAVACALVGFAGLAAHQGAAAQLQSFAVLIEVVGALFAAAGVSMAALLRRRTGGKDLLELAMTGPQPAFSHQLGGDLAEPIQDQPGSEDADPDGAEPDESTSELADDSEEEG
ncbi:MAG TPA: CoA transferase [Candidatus Nanopelagicaceae bacterium]|nr:CoA transferase [Candidatus Nanopelagicaceae bacterium]